PEGANVREEGREVCAATPCDVTFQTTDKKTKKLLFVKNGFRAATKEIGSTDSMVNVTLAKAGGGFVPHQQSHETPDKGESTSTPEGFKDLPY
ncbi:MAG: hypothetical protein ACRELY_32720, partial [Polyangiaceae bacterium]